ncbi:MAG: ThiF family adenylyltransferase [Chloroflexi bacterium AL-W]|nr:ThiF family adenylyltransferase [Chloroflexi bacterium AL-N1]NOK68897.1 ThiF family adenylyltransferase [Chloroflexi bacterium AL-N10]NOK76880.1 ThiF family adenylyltransferase [Chloroflexi bacterium AL-N5]NOK82732.1 ThiF family adenylyltransferase [Chloroflexi bacterium AL-W]NOK90737.1 ThiF family adenylyltransferase [Chloroflexi bacterium AL-N15]
MNDPQMVVRLHKGWRYLSVSDGIELWSLVQQRRIKIRGKVERLNTVMSQLRNGIPIETCQQVVANCLSTSLQYANQFLEHLRQSGIVLYAPQEAATPPTSTRNLYDPQINFLNSFEREGVSGSTLDWQLRNRRVVIVGLGGFGSWVGLLLARIGIRHIVAIDHDRVEVSNLSRQILYTNEDVGHFKVDAAAKRFVEADSDIQYESHVLDIKKSEDLIPLITEADLVFMLFGYIPNRARNAITTACIEAQVPFLVAGGNVLGPLCIPGKTPCHQCVVQQETTLSETAHVFETNSSVESISPFAPLLTMMSGYVVWEAACFLSGCAQPQTLHGVYSFNLLDYQIQFLEVERLSNCACCGAPILAT